MTRFKNEKFSKDFLHLLSSPLLTLIIVVVFAIFTSIPSNKTPFSRFCNSFCEKKYKSKTGLKSHYLQVHQDKYEFKCNTCNKAFKQKRMMIIHSSKHRIISTSLVIIGYTNSPLQTASDKLPNYCSF